MVGNNTTADRVEEPAKRWQKKVEGVTQSLHNSCTEVGTDAATTQEDETDEVLSYHEIAVAVQALVDVAIEVSELSWERTDACPYCGGTNLGRLYEGTEKVNHYENGPSKSKGMHPSTEVLGYECYECNQMIKISPKGLLTVENGWKLDNHPTLQAALKAHCQQTESEDSENWESGDECTFCTRRDTRETNIYAEPMTPLGNDVEFHHDTQVIDIVSTVCDGCGEALYVSPLDGINLSFN